MQSNPAFKITPVDKTLRKRPFFYSLDSICPTHVDNVVSHDEVTENHIE